MDTGYLFCPGISTNSGKQGHNSESHTALAVVTYLLAYGIDVCPTDLVGASNIVLQVDLLTQIHLAGNGGEYKTLLSPVGQGELDLPVKPSRSEEGRVKSICSVCCHDNL